MISKGFKGFFLGDAEFSVETDDNMLVSDKVEIDYDGNNNNRLEGETQDAQNTQEIQAPEFDPNLAQFKVVLSNQEKAVCLKEIIKKLKKILYVYEKSLEPNSTYNYRIYCGGVLIYVSSSNLLFNGELVNIVINLNAIMTNKFSKPQLKRVVFESINYASFLLAKYEKLESEESSQVSKNNQTKEEA